MRALAQIRLLCQFRATSTSRGLACRPALRSLGHGPCAACLPLRTSYRTGYDISTDGYLAANATGREHSSNCSACPRSSCRCPSMGGGNTGSHCPWIVDNSPHWWADRRYVWCHCRNIRGHLAPVTTPLALLALILSGNWQHLRTTDHKKWFVML